MESLNPTEFASAVTAITSAFGDPTRREIYLFVHQSNDGVTASEVAEHFELHANVARHHLDKLAAGGYLEITTFRPAGGAGRPSKRYRTSDEQVHLRVPVRQDDMLVQLLGRALSELGPERAGALAEEVGEEYGQALAEAMGEQGTRSVKSAIHAVADALSAHGFAAHTEKSGNSLRIVTEHCPFGAAAQEHPVICGLDRGMVRGMLKTLHGETTVDVSQGLSDGAPMCVTAVENFPVPEPTVRR